MNGKASGLGRTMRYFMRYVCQYMAGTVLGAFGMPVYMWVINGASLSFGEMLQEAPNMMVFVSMMVLMGIGLSAGQYWYSAPISFGCLRKHVFWGNFAMDMLYIAGSACLYQVMALIIRPAKILFAVPTVVALFLAMEGVTRLLGIANLKWGRAGKVLMAACMIMVTVGFVFFVGFFGIMGTEATGILTDKMLEGPMQWAGLAIGAAVSIIANIANYQMLMKYEVRV